jgi:hypothetical protein
MRGRRGKAALWFVVTVAMVFAVGFYRDAIGDGEAASFGLNYPATGKDVGGIGARGTEGYALVNLAHMGLLKKMTQPNVVEFSSHFVKNVGDEARRIRLEAEGFAYPVRWESNEATWDEEKREIGRPLQPGSMVTVHLFVTLPKPLPPGDTILDGKIVVYDADTDERLSALPVFVVRNNAAATKAGDCCGQ